MAHSLFDRNLRGLAWDDMPEDYLRPLVRRMKDKQFAYDIEITSERDVFIRRFHDDGPWDFVILDVEDTESVKGNPNTSAGIDLAYDIRKENRHIPIIFLTINTESLEHGKLRVSPPVFILGKHADYASIIMRFRNFLNSHDFSRVFIIYGRDRTADGLRSSVIKKIKDMGATPEFIKPENVDSLLLKDLYARMKKSWAFVALCTPDDRVSEEYYQPRQNVLFEMGLAVGIMGSSDRLVVIQKYGNEADQKAELPTDLDGKLHIRYKDNMDEAIARMINKLRNVGVRFDAAL